MTALEERTISKQKTGADDENLPSLFGRLSDDVTKLLDLRIDLLKVEIKEEVNAYVRGVLTIMIGLVVAAVGLALANVALAFFVSTLFANTDLSQPARYGLGFILTGIVYLLLGIVAVIVSKNRLARQGLVPKRSVKEFEKDKELVKTVFES
ncbi:MAG: phage holin family protein [Acidobacteriota bacterium]